MPKLYRVVLRMTLVGCAAAGPTVSVEALAVDDPAITVMEHHRIDRLLDHVPFPDATGAVMTVSTTRSIDLGNEFFQDLGSNGRRCVSCHLPSAGWGITPGQVRAIFRTNDGSNSPDADVSTVAKRRQ